MPDTQEIWKRSVERVVIDSFKIFGKLCIRLKCYVLEKAKGYSFVSWEKVWNKCQKRSEEGKHTVLSYQCALLPFIKFVLSPALDNLLHCSHLNIHNFPFQHTKVITIFWSPNGKQYTVQQVQTGIVYCWCDCHLSHLLVSAQAFFSLIKI